MKYTDNALNILTAKSYKGIGNAWIVKNLGHDESVETIVNRISQTAKGQSVTLWDFEQKKRNYESILLDRLEGCCDGVVALGDDDFPQHRGMVKDSERPVFLFYKGDIELLDASNKNVSVIGLLNPTEEIEHREKELVAQLVRNGATIVSGLALGCDSVSHREALNSNGKTIAILPSPLTSILPASNKRLASQIVEEGGLLITEYGNNFKSKMELSTRYKERDRLQALFCDTIVLAASYSHDSADKWSHLAGQKLDSGARLAMGYAKEYGISRAVMYDERNDREDPMFDLCREIIKETRDVMVITQDDCIDKAREIMTKIAKKRNAANEERRLFD